MNRTFLPLVFCLLFLPSAPGQSAPENLALHRDYVSSSPNTRGWDKPGLTDGVAGRDNKTCYATDDKPEFPKTVTVDLAAVRPFASVVVSVPPFGATKTVEVSVSEDGQNFTTFGRYVFEAADAQRAVLTGKARARYVRLTYPDHYDEGRGYSPNFVFTSELEVYDGPAPAEPPPEALATTPAPKDTNGHQQFLDRVAVDPNVGLLFLGDSITDFWPRTGEATWLKFAPFHPADFGVSGDKTEHLLWRITNGELDTIRPRVVVIMIGTNNVTRDTPAAEAAGITRVVETVRAKLPDAKVLLLAVFPRDALNSANRRKNTETNAIIARLADGQRVQFLDIGSVFLTPGGEIVHDLLPDNLHPGVKGYESWYQAMWPTLQKMLR